MTMELLFAAVFFAFVSSISPGPNNLMLMASGANFGFNRSVPHMLGIGIGFTVMIVLVGAGLTQLFDLFPNSYTLLKFGSVLYLGWLAWNIAHTSALEDAEEPAAQPLTFIQAAAFQWVNPKAWAMSLTATSAYAPTQEFKDILLVAAIFGLVNFPCISTWTFMGRELRRILNNPARLRLFNRTMAGLLMASIYPVLFAFT